MSNPVFGSLLTLVVFGLVSCTSVLQPEIPEEEARYESAYTILWSAQNSTFRNSLRLVIRDSATLHEFLREHGYAAVPLSWATDFDRHVIIVAALGQRPTSGYAICVDSVRAEAEGAVAHVTTASAVTGGVQQWATHPVHVVRTPRFEGPLTFREREIEGGLCQPSLEAHP